jgi:hypothetical protein
MRANPGLKPTEYAVPIFSLILLRFADAKYSKYEAAINESPYGDICIFVLLFK